MGTDDTKHRLESLVEYAKSMMPEVDFISLASLSDIDLVARYRLYDSGGVEYIASRIFFDSFMSEDTGDLTRQYDMVTKEPYATLEDLKEIGLFYQRVAKNPELYGVPADILGRHKEQQAWYARAWAWMNIEALVSIDPVAEKIAANKRVQIAAWQWAETIFGSIEKTASAKTKLN